MLKPRATRIINIWRASSRTFAQCNVNPPVSNCCSYQTQVLGNYYYWKQHSESLKRYKLHVIAEQTTRWDCDRQQRDSNNTLWLQVNHRLRGSGSTVVTMTSKVNGTMQILTPCRSETPENIETKIGHNDYIMGPFNPANFHRNRSNGICSPYSWNITLKCVIPFLSFPFLSFPFFLVVAYSKNGWTDFHNLYLKRRGLTQGSAFWGFRWEKNCSGTKTP